MNEQLKSEALESLACSLYSIGPLKEVTLNDAVKFMESIPDDVPLPELGLTEAKDVTFEWVKSGWKIVTAIVDGTGMVHYSALFGAVKTCGYYCLDDPFNPLLRDLIAEVLLEEKTK